MPALVLAAALALAGCAADDAPTSPTSTDTATDARSATDTGDEMAGDTPERGSDEHVDPTLTLVATLAPITDLVARVGGERVEVSSMVPPGADAHTYEPRPQDVVGLSAADAYLGVGLALNDGALRLATENLPDDARLVLLGEAALDEDDLVFDHGHSHDDDHGHSHDDDHGHSHDDDDGLGPNPHVWTSVVNAIRLVDAIEATLVELDPDGASVYAANADGLRAELDELHLEIRDAAVTIPATNRTLVAYHDAWTYFARDYGLDFATAIQPADYAEPSANEVRRLIDRIRELDVEVVFGSEEFPTPVLETIAEETDARYVANLADDVLPGDPGDPEHTYPAMMRRNAVAIIGGLGGDVSLLER